MISTAVICTFLLGTALAIPHPHHVDGQPVRKPGDPYRLCIPQKALKACQQMVEQGKSVGVHMSCIVARDRLDCIEKIEHHAADWGAVDPEDMYIAAHYADDLFGVFAEMRTKEEPENEFRYEAVAVIHKDLKIDNLQQLKGLKSCHTGVGRNVGYKIPITKLTQMEILPPLNNTALSSRENELKALSEFFSKACLVGTWSPDAETNSRWKAAYHNLCELCEYPEKCDYPDNHSGYEGALKCLVDGGQVAWTKVIYVKKFFGMAYGTKPAKTVEGVNKEDYAYLCPDATKRPITGPPCTWAARPWQGYMANTEITAVANDVKELRNQLLALNKLGDSSHADWIATVLALNDETLAVVNKGPFHPHEYLDKANYSDVIERDVLKPAPKVRMCVTSKLENQKCVHLQKAAFSRDIRPEFQCVQKSSQEECFDAIKNKQADIAIIDAGLLEPAESKGLEPVLAELLNNNRSSQYVVALVKEGSPINSLNDLKGKKACMSLTGEAAGWQVPIFALKKVKAIKKTDCPHKNALSEFFSHVEQTNDPIKCLDTGKGDVAFAGSEELQWIKENIEHFNSKNYALLRFENGKCGSDKAKECNLGSVPSRVVVANKQLTDVERDDIIFSVLSAGKTFGKYPEIFLLFGHYKNEPNVLFSDYAQSFTSIHNNNDVIESLKNMKNIRTEIGSCPA